MLKKTLSVLLVFVLCLGMIPGALPIAGAAFVEGCTFNVVAGDKSFAEAGFTLYPGLVNNPAQTNQDGSQTVISNTVSRYQLKHTDGTAVSVDTIKATIKKITINDGDPVDFGKFSSSATIVVVSDCDTNVGFQFYDNGLQIQIPKKDTLTISGNVTVKFYFEDDGSNNDDWFSITATLSDNNTGLVEEPVKSVVKDNTWTLTATPTAYGYGLDHWEYKGASTGGEWAVAGDSYQKAAYTVTIDEDREYKAVFEKAFFALLGDTAVVGKPENPNVIWERNPNYGYDLAGFQRQGTFQSSFNGLTNGDIREGTFALLSFQARTLWPFVQNEDKYALATPSAQNAFAISGLMPLNIRIYAGEGTSGECIWNYETYKSFGFWQISDIDMWYCFNIPHAILMNKVTVEFEVGPKSSPYYAVTQKTYTLSGATIIPDTLKAERAAAIAEIDAAMAWCQTQEKYKSDSEIRGLVQSVCDAAIASISAVALPSVGDAEQIASIKQAALNKVSSLLASGDTGDAITVAVTVEKLIDGGRYVLEPTLIVIPKDSSAMYAFKAALEREYPETEIGMKPYKSTPNYEHPEYISSIYDPDSGDYKSESGVGGGWMYALNNSFPNLGAAYITVKDHDVMRWQLTANLGKDIGGGGASLGGGSGGDSDDSGVGTVRANKDALIWKVAEINRAGTKDAYGTAYTGAMTVLTTLGSTQQQADAALVALNVALDGVKTVQDLITAIGTVDADSGDKIAQARGAYNALTAAQQAQVLNYAALTAAETAFASFAPVIDVKNKINAIGSVSPESGALITATRTAYNALTAAQKSQVTNYATLAAAELAYAGLTVSDSDYAPKLAAAQTYIRSLVTNPESASVGGEWAVLALARGGAVTPSDPWAKTYGANVKTLLSGGLDAITTNKFTEYSRMIIGLTSVGVDASKVAFGGQTYDVTSKLLEYDKVVNQGINGAAYALLALDTKPYLPANMAIRDQYINHMLNAKLAGGGFGIDGETADADTTAYVIQALAPYYGQANVKSAVDAGLTKLKAMQDAAAGGFYNGGAYNSESAAQVIVALTALGKDPMGAEWTVNGGRNPITALLSFYDTATGGFRHTSSGNVDLMATEQAAYALAAYNRFKNSQPNLYTMSDVVFAAPVNKANLQAAITGTEGLTEADYTAASWAAFAGAKNAATSVNVNADATQAEVDAASYAILNGLINLVTAPDKTLLVKAIALAPSSGADYTTASWSVVSSKLFGANAINAKTDASQSEIAIATDELIAAINSLERNGLTLEANTAVLNAAMAQANALNSTAYANWNTVSAALANANAITENSTQSEVDAAATAIITAIKGLQKHNAVVQAAIEIAITVGDTATADMLTNALASGDVNAALAEAAVRLSNASRATAIDKSDLNAVISTANGKTQADYTPESWAAFASALSSAIAAQSSSAQSEIDGAVLALSRAMSELVAITSPGGGNGGGTDNSGDGNNNGGDTGNNNGGDTGNSTGGGGSTSSTAKGGAKDAATPATGIEVKATEKDGVAIAAVGSDAVKTAIGKAKEGGSDALAITVTGTDKAKSIEVDIPKESIAEILKNGLTLEVKTPNGTVGFSKAALETIAAQSGNTVEIVITDGGANASVGAANQEFDLTVKVGGVVIHDFKGEVTVKIPFTPPTDTKAEDYDLLTVYYVDENGKLSEIKGAYYDAKTKQIVFKTGRFSKFVIAEWISPFSDVVKGAWYYKAVRYGYSNGLVIGTTIATFAPESSLTRAQLVTLFYRNADSPTVTGGSPFSDVADGQWYTDAVIWAAQNNIVSGYGNGKFGTNDLVTREQFAAILHRLSGAPASASIDAKYTDADKVSSWAASAVAWATNTGLITGRTTTTVVPDGTVNRAEAATLLQRYIEGEK